MTLTNQYLLFNKGHCCFHIDKTAIGLCVFSASIVYSPISLSVTQNLLTVSRWLQTTEETHLYASLLLWALKQQMGKMVDPGPSRPPTLPCPSVPALACQAKSAREPAPLSPPEGGLCVGAARAWHSNLWNMGSTGQRVRLVPCSTSVLHPNLCPLWQKKKKREKGGGGWGYWDG